MYLRNNIFLLIVLRGGVFKIILELTEKVDMTWEWNPVFYLTELYGLLQGMSTPFQADPVRYLYQEIIFLPNILFLLLKNSSVLLAE